MQAKSKFIVDFMSGKDKQFLIPVYQRNYNWKKTEQCQILWDDLLYMTNQENATPHFFGSIVSVTDESRALIIIDGQQRLTTISLLLLAMAHKLQDIEDTYRSRGIVLTKELPNINDILDLCVDSKNKHKLKLKLIRGDMDAYEALINKQNTSKFDKTNIVQNYNFFYSLLDPENINSIYNAVKRLEIVDIILGNQDDNPQLVFESLNSKGMDLTDADKIRNFILIGKDYEEQEKLYSQYWQQMEENVGTCPEDTSEYIWYYLAYKMEKKFPKPDIYKQFKEYKPLNCSTENLLSELLDLSEIYHEIRYIDCKNDKVNKKLDELLSDLRTKSAIPLLLDIFNRQKQGLLTYNDIIEIIDIIESWYVRRCVCRYKTAGSDKFFLMTKKISNILNSFENATYVDAFKYLVYTDKTPLKFPDDNEFRSALASGDIYTTDNKTCKYLLSQIEKHYNEKEYVDTEPLTIEHIMPQTLDDDWKSDLGTEWETTYNKYLHTLGNLTLTGYNSEYSNKRFSFKKRIANGFDQSPLYLNSMMKQVDRWTSEEIISRSGTLVPKAMSIWPTYKPDYNYNQKNFIEKVCLDNEELHSIITNRKPQSIYFHLIDQDIDVISWKDIYIRLLNILYSDTTYRINMKKVFSFGGKDGKFSGLISKKNESIGKNGDVLWEQIIPNEDIYFMTKKSAFDMLQALKTWFDYLGISYEDLEITLKPIK